MTPRPATRPGQRGVAAIELTIILLMMALLLPVTMYLSRLLWNHLVLVHATHASATSIASLAIAETSGSDAFGTIDTLADMVRDDVNAALLEPIDRPDTRCTPVAVCTNMKGGTVAVDSFAQVTELNFSNSIFLYDSPDGIMYLRAVSTVPYANRPLAY